MLSKDWGQRQNQYDFTIIGSGNGGAIKAAASVVKAVLTRQFFIHSKPWNGLPAVLF